MMLPRSERKAPIADCPSPKTSDEVKEADDDQSISEASTSPSPSVKKEDI